MTRRRREESPTGIYHVTSRGNAGESIFLDGYDRDWFLTLLARVVERDGWRLFAYCLMDTHFHLVVRAELDTLGRGMQRLKGRYGQLFNERHDREGHLFEARYYSKPVRTEAHAIKVAAYVALNPVAAGLCRGAADWRWSSHRAQAGLASPPWFLADLGELGIFGDGGRSAADAYRDFVEAAERELAVRGQTPSASVPEPEAETALPRGQIPKVSDPEHGFREQTPPASVHLTAGSDTEGV